MNTESLALLLLSVCHWNRLAECQCACEWKAQSGNPDCRFTAIGCEFTQHSLQNLSAIDTFQLQPSHHVDLDSCAAWIQQVPRVLRNFVVVAPSQFAECLRRAKHKFAFGPKLGHFIVSVALADEDWLRTVGAFSFSELGRTEVTNFYLERVRLRSLKSVVANLRAATLGFYRNQLQAIQVGDFDGYDVSKLRHLDIKRNPLCVFELGALGNARNLATISVSKDSPMQLNLTAQQWNVLRTYPRGALVSTNRSCQQFLHESSYLDCSFSDVAQVIDLLDGTESALILPNDAAGFSCYLNRLDNVTIAQTATETPDEVLVSDDLAQSNSSDSRFELTPRVSQPANHSQPVSGTDIWNLLTKAGSEVLLPAALSLTAAICFGLVILVVVLLCKRESSARRRSCNPTERASFTLTTSYSYELQ